MFPSYWKSKKLVPSYFESDKNCCSYLEREKNGSQLFGDQKNTVRSKEKYYSQLLGKKFFPSIWKCIKLDPSYFEPDKHCCRYFERGKSGSLLFGDQKMQFTTVTRKEKDYNIYLKSEKLVHSQQEHEKKCFPAIWKWKKLVPSYFEPDKHCCSYLEREKSGFPAIWRPKNVVHNCQEQGKRL